MMKTHTAWVFVVTVLATTAAWGQVDPADARFETGRDLRRQRRDADALAHFERLYADTHQPRALAQVGLAEAALGRWADAELHVAQALATPDAWVTANRATGANLEYQSRLIAVHLGSLEVVCDRPGAEVWANGHRLATLPLQRALRVEAGVFRFEVRAEGVAAVQRAATIAPSGLSREVVNLAGTPAAPVTPGPTTPAGITVSSTRGAQPPATQGSGLTRTLAWAAAGGAVAFLATGGISWAVASSAADRWNDDQQCLRPGLTREQVCGGDGDTARTMNALAVVGFVGGTALAATATALFLTSGRSRATTAALSCGPGLGELGLACAGRF